MGWDVTVNSWRFMSPSDWVVRNTWSRQARLTSNTRFGKFISSSFLVETRCRPVQAVVGKMRPAGTSSTSRSCPEMFPRFPRLHWLALNRPDLEAYNPPPALEPQLSYESWLPGRWLSQNYKIKKKTSVFSWICIAVLGKPSRTGGPKLAISNLEHAAKARLSFHFLDALSCNIQASVWKRA